MRPAEGILPPERAELRRRVRRTAWIIVAVITALGVGSALFIARNGRKSRTVLHSELMKGVGSWT